MANFVVLNDESNVLGVIQGIEDEKSFLEKLGVLIANEILDGATPMAIIESITDSFAPLTEDEDGDPILGPNLSFEDICTGGTVMADVWYLNSSGDPYNVDLFISNTYIY